MSVIVLQRYYFYFENLVWTLLEICPPFVRTLVPMLAGIGEMKVREFTLFNVIGAALWAAGSANKGDFPGPGLLQNGDKGHYSGRRSFARSS